MKDALRVRFNAFSAFNRLVLRGWRTFSEPTEPIIGVDNGNCSHFSALIKEDV